MSKIIAVIGATGAQGLAVVKHLLAESSDGSASPWKVRALTRNPNHERAKELESLGVEILQGSFLEPATLHKLFKGAYGAFVNTDTFTIGATAELHSAFVIWEVAHMHKLRHFVWSNLDYALRLGNYDSTYSCDHTNAKGRFGDFLMSQPNQVDEKDGTMWSLLTTGPYMDMLHVLFAPLSIREDGTRVFRSPMGHGGSIPLISLDDIGWWARYTFDNTSTTTGKNLKIASEPSNFPHIVETFKRVTGLPAEYEALSMDDYFSLWNGNEIPLASDDPEGISWEDNFRAWWAMWRDHLVKRDMEWIRGIHPPTTLEAWIRDNDYTGKMSMNLLKDTQDNKMQLRRRK